MNSADAGTTPGDFDSEGCLIILASYSDVAPVVGAVARQTNARIMMSPALGDFTELRFVNAGARPESGTSSQLAVRRIARALTSPASAAGRSYFALIVADHGAAAVDELLRQCADDPVISALPLRSHGFASVDDRQVAKEPDDAAASGPDLAPAIVISPAGAWTRSTLVEELRRHAEELMRDFATWSTPGLSPEQLEQLRPQDATVAMKQPAARAQPDVLRPLTVTIARPDNPALPTDKPDPAPVRSPTKRLAMLPDPADLAPAERFAALTELVAAPDDVTVAGPPEENGEASPDDAASPDGKASAHAARVLAPRRFELVDVARRKILALPWPRGRAASPPPHTVNQNQTAPAAEQPTAISVVYLVLISDEGQSDGTGWRRGRSVLLDLDEKLAATRGVCHQVRVLRHASELADSRPRPAGQADKRDLRRPVEQNRPAQNATHHAKRAETGPHRPRVDRRRCPAACDRLFRGSRTARRPGLDRGV